MYLSFDIGGTSIKYGVVSKKGEILEKSKIATPKTAQELLDALTAVVKDFQQNYKLKGIGIAAPGIVSDDGVMTTFGALTEMYGLALRERLFNATNLPVAVENDANAAAIAEHWLGGAKDLNTYITIVVGTGLGGGLIVNGKVYRGGHGFAGELGWPLYHDIPEEREIEPASENFHSATVLGLLRRYNLALDERGEHEPFSDTKKLIEQAEAGDTRATEIFDSFVKDLAINLLNLFAIFDPEAILIGGGISENSYFMKKLQTTWHDLISRHEALNRVEHMGILGKLRKARLGNDAGLLGATYTIKTHLKK